MTVVLLRPHNDVGAGDTAVVAAQECSRFVSRSDLSARKRPRRLEQRRISRRKPVLPDEARLVSFCQRARQRLPRSRGDGPWQIPSPTYTTLAPPLTRGWTRCASTSAPCPSGSPAHAGMDPGCPAPSSLPTRLPRSRGDGPSPIAWRASSMAAPPLTRGWTLMCNAPAALGGGSPAHAGMDPVTP